MTSSAIPTLPSGVWRALAMPYARATVIEHKYTGTLDIYVYVCICTYVSTSAWAMDENINVDPHSGVQDKGGRAFGHYSFPGMTRP